MHSRIFRFIESLQMTQSDFASKTGISPSALTQLKNNAGNLSIDNVIKIKKAFPNISLDWLISGDGEMYEKINDSQSPSLFPDFVDNVAKQEIMPPATAYEETRRSVSENDERTMPIPTTATATTRRKNSRKDCREDDTQNNSFLRRRQVRGVGKRVTRLVIQKNY